MLAATIDAQSWLEARRVSRFKARRAIPTALIEAHPAAEIIEVQGARSKPGFGLFGPRLRRPPRRDNEGARVVAPRDDVTISCSSTAARRTRHVQAQS